MSLVNLTINGKHVSAPSGTSILDAAEINKYKNTQPLSFTYE